MTRWCVRDEWTGVLLGTIEAPNIDYALSRARVQFYHMVTVDDGVPVHKHKPVIRYELLHSM